MCRKSSTKIQKRKKLEGDPCLLIAFTNWNYSPKWLWPAKISGLLSISKLRLNKLTIVHQTGTLLRYWTIYQFIISFFFP